MAVVANYPWEQAQSRLYIGVDGNDIAWWMCAAASIADGLLLLLLVRIGCAVTGRPDWYLQPGRSGYAGLLLSGAIVSVVVERMMISTAQWWTYSASMPLVPGLGVGVAPLAQMLVLPPLIVALRAWWYRRMVGKGA